MEIKGIVKRIGETEQITESFQKRELILEYAENPKYPELIKLEAHQDKVGILDSVKIGQEVTAHFNLRGKEAKNGQVYNTLVLWKIQ